MIISTGVATADEINEALAACRKVGNDDITLLKCTTEYPAPIEKANLKMIPVYKEVFGVKAGLSDHTMGSIVPVVATALGATMIEKHFIIDRSIGGPDSSFSMNKEEFAQMVKDVRMTEKAIGNVRFPLPEEINMREHRSLYVAKDMKKGDVITEENVRSVRPGYGLAPKYLPEILGKRVNCDLEMGERMSLKYVDN
jgi:pseudaminic acid synthase